MTSLTSGAFDVLLEPLSAMCGPRLSMCRAGTTVSWVLDGRAAYVEADGEGVRATFADGDQVGAQGRYRLTGDGARRLAADLVAFFTAGECSPRAVGLRESDFARA